mmetsp:Transcript_5509/g.5743  ORF Transcript_5509/g.5743 Transcript_5509/m.5743 type:complete len:101 (+) Transcript_5509:68-370(+)
MPTSDERQSDPEGLISQVVKIVETARDDLNGSLGTVISYNVEVRMELLMMFSAFPSVKTHRWFTLFHFFAYSPVLLKIMIKEEPVLRKCVVAKCAANFLA